MYQGCQFWRGKILQISYVEWNHWDTHTYTVWIDKKSLWHFLFHNIMRTTWTKIKPNIMVIEQQKKICISANPCIQRRKLVDWLCSHEESDEEILSAHTNQLALSKSCKQAITCCYIYPQKNETIVTEYNIEKWYLISLKYPISESTVKK